MEFYSDSVGQLQQSKCLQPLSIEFHETSVISSPDIMGWWCGHVVSSRHGAGVPGEEGGGERDGAANQVDE